MPGPASEVPSDDEQVPSVEPAPQAQAPDADAPRPLGVPRAATGHAEVDAQLERLADVDHLATDGHLEVYEDVHAGLRDTLTALDTRQGPPVPGGVPARPYDHRS
ncbi:hypothetical protein H9Y04_22140 [Streptomyces sp. TRM66268-LWL]|uniref:Uncharacterized protein n=2 Tax=Streptomyces polyasparticus TaxID=2767826 RepID=A0ABR7SK67_9ACTN|nr:hypothetical protein [Streptomyces polyasparticus]